jgi:hypothetical protein
MRRYPTGQLRIVFRKNGHDYESKKIWIRRRLVPARFFASFGPQTQSQPSGAKYEESKMKTIAGFIVTLFLLAFAFAPSRLMGLPPPPPNFSPTLISPTAGQVLYPGQQVRVDWQTSIPNRDYPAWCEIELWLSLDGGTTYTMRITPSMDPNTRFFYWIVPNTPTNSAMLDIRFGCEPVYPEGYHPQTGSPFVIANPGGQ